MKVFFKKEISAYSGKDKDADIVFSSHRNGGVCIARDYTEPRQTAQSEIFKANSKTMKTLWSAVSAGYKDDIKKYSRQLGLDLPNTQIAPTSYSLFTRIVYAYAKDNTLQVSDLEYNTLKASTIKDVSGAVTLGYIKAVDGADQLTISM